MINKQNILNVLGKVSLEDMYIQQLFGYYRECYLKEEPMQQFVQSSPRIPEELNGHSYIGVCNRTFGKVVAKARQLEGGAIRGGLLNVGLLKPSNCGELFRGCIVFPEADAYGKIVSAVGYRFGDRIRHWQSLVIQWERPETEQFVSEGMQLVKEVLYEKACH
jgi:hypothetical protein